METGTARNVDDRAQGAAASAADGPGLDWKRAEQLLSTLRQPESWRQSVSEVVTFETDTVVRRVTLNISPEMVSASSEETGDVLHIVVMTPNKGQASHIEVTDGESRLLDHDEHLAMTQVMVLFRFMSVIEEATRLGLLKKSAVLSLKDVAKRLREIAPEPNARVARAALNAHFNGRWLRGIKVAGKRERSLAVQMDLLYRLCESVAERYYKILRVERLAASPRPISYSYRKPSRQRPHGWLLPRILRQVLRAPGGWFFLHVPLARLTRQYEISLSSLTGYYALEQRATLDEPDSEPTGEARMILKQASKEEPWFSLEPGRMSTPRIFIGNGITSKKRIFVGVNYEEVPPGAVGHAFTAHVFTSVIAVALLIWALNHEPDTGVETAGVIASLVALASGAVDWLIPRVNMLNAPALPRFLLFTQSLAMALFAVWILARGTAHSVLEPIVMVREPAHFITDFEWLAGTLLVLLVVAQTVLLGTRVRASVRAYDSFNKVDTRGTSE